MRIPAFAIALCLALAACAVPSDDTAQVLSQESLAPSLQKITPTTSTTSVPVEPRDFAYYLLGNRADSDQREVRQVVAPVAFTNLLEAVEPMEVEGFRATITDDESLLNQVSQYDVVDIEVDDGVATVFLLTLGEAPDNSPLRDVAAQLVWTLTGASDDIRAILINIDGAPAQIPTTNTDDDSVTNRPVTTDDFVLYNPESDEVVTETSTTSTTTSTTVPADN